MKIMINISNYHYMGHGYIVLVTAYGNVDPDSYYSGFHPLV